MTVLDEKVRKRATGKSYFPATNLSALLTTNNVRNRDARLRDIGAQDDIATDCLCSRLLQVGFQ
jgi:hypothetical protein